MSLNRLFEKWDLRGNSYTSSNKNNGIVSSNLNNKTMWAGEKGAIIISLITGNSVLGIDPRRMSDRHNFLGEPSSGLDQKMEGGVLAFRPPGNGQGMALQKRPEADTWDNDINMLSGSYGPRSWKNKTKRNLVVLSNNIDFRSTISKSQAATQADQEFQA